MTIFDVIIIGGGLSGLSSAAELSSLGLKVLLLEQRRFCGGRTYSLTDPKTSDPVDNGQHLMMGCYHATRQFLRLIGTEKLASLQSALHINYLQSSGEKFDLTLLRLPAPMHLAAGLFNFNAVSLKEQIKIGKVFMEILRWSAASEDKLDQLTVEEWLEKLDQSEIGRKYLWDIITIGALNNSPKNVSALMLKRVLRAAFFGARDNSSLLIPNVSLNELFVEPAVRFISSHGGEVRIESSVENLVVEGAKIRSARLKEGGEINGKFFISAVPWYSAQTILPIQKIDYGKYQSSPIVSINLWLDRNITDLDFAALPGKRIQWLFNKTKLLKRSDSTPQKLKGQYISTVISGAKEYVALSDENLVKIAIEDLGSVIPELLRANVVHSMVIREKRATFSPLPGLDAFRPRTNTEFENLFLAGDWTATGYPATIEGAIISGNKSAEAIKNLIR